MSTPFISIKNLKKSYGTTVAVDTISFDIYEGETVGIVGESGSGKTTTGQLIVRLIEPTSGSIHYQGRDILKLSQKQFQKLRRDLQIIFQDPSSSLNPRMTIEDIIGEPLDIHKLATKQSRRERIVQLLELVGLSESFMQRFPHELSGGQKQRVGIARALACEPKFIICDEALSALDVSVQAQIVNLLKDLQKKLKLTYLFISHDLTMVNYLADRIGVMQHGKIVEFEKTDELFKNPKHPYTRSLLQAVTKQPL